MEQPFSERLNEAIKVGMVQVDLDERQAIIIAPPNVAALTDDEWIAVLQAASEIWQELDRLGYTVQG